MFKTITHTSSSPIESCELPGFFEIPGYQTYLISKKAQIYNRKRKAYLHCPSEGSYAVVTLTDNEGKRVTWGVHRLMACVFLRSELDVSRLVVNHLNAKPWDNRLENLEWCSYQENLEHAGSMGLTSKCIPISVRCCLTGEITHYPSATAYARENGLTKDAVLWRLKSGEDKVYPELKQYRPKNESEDKSWVVPVDIQKAVMQYGTSKPLLVKFHNDDGEITEFEKLKDFAKYVGIAEPTATQWANLEGQPVLPGFIQLKMAYAEEEWREPDDLYLELEKTTKKRCIIVLGDYDFRDIYTSAIECAVDRNINPTALNYRLSTKGKKKFKDGFRYMYYSDYVAEQSGSLQTVMSESNAL